MRKALPLRFKDPLRASDLQAHHVFGHPHPLLGNDAAVRRCDVQQEAPFKRPGMLFTILVALWAPLASAGAGGPSFEEQESPSIALNS